MMYAGGTKGWRRAKHERWSPDRILREFGAIGPPVDVRNIARSMGIRTHEVHNPGWSGALDTSDGVANLWVNTEHQEIRKRFTIAHEMGHLILHPLGIQYRDASFTGTKEETQANNFAGDLLVPLWMLQPVASRLSVQQLASLFVVSQAVIGVRLLRLAGG